MTMMQIIRQMRELWSYDSVAVVTEIQRQPGPAFMDTRYFDMTLDDGRVYRVRVSDITPEDATPVRMTEGSGT